MGMIKDIIEGFELPKGIAGVLSLMCVTAWLTYIIVSTNSTHQMEHHKMIQSISNNTTFMSMVESNVVKKIHKYWTIDNMKTLYASRDWHNNTNLTAYERRVIIDDITKDNN